MPETDRPWWTVEDAAQLLRVNRKTLYAAIAADDFPHTKLGAFIRIPAEALRLSVRPQTRSRSWHLTDDFMQLELPLDVSCLIPVRRFRNTREVIKPFHYEGALYVQKVRRVPLERHRSQSERRIK